MTQIPRITLRDGREVPVIKFGTVNIKGQVGKLAMMEAINNGYRSIDTSTNYHNEGIVGQAIRESGIPRSEFVITSKLPGMFHQYDDALMSIQEQLARLGLTYLDEYIIHWPNPKDGLYVEAWQALVDAQKLGLVKTIGVSNFEKEHLDKIIEATGVVPAVNQIEMSPYFNNEDLHAYHQALGIHSEAWSPTGRHISNVKEDGALETLAKKYGKSTTQVILRWNYQRGVINVVKASQSAHQRENAAIFDFELSDEDMAAIFALDKGEAGRVEGQNPHDYHEYD
ncbi:aldo/keto reductase [Streptococcus pluranimalium]|uniref:Aldo/keto reductase n=1 Tax=Streptococcus pluranimalium TaxID=82348 RepID=A0A2L0D4Z0_9STRE|nr:aldo/keto reductase [Streptococcus pluranimalium]AUW96898.1 aldo/keto reductase [Streptococcus pluranimalium]MDY3042535.1 aldo/keto reductase [Streptococcus pluranimalium]